VVIYRLFGEKLPLPIETKICMAANLTDIITHAKYQHDIFRGYDFTGGRISHFLIDFCMGLTTVQRYCTADDNMYLRQGGYVLPGVCPSVCLSVCL